MKRYLQNAHLQVLGNMLLSACPTAACIISSSRWRAYLFMGYLLDIFVVAVTFHWRHNERNGVSNYRCGDCFLNRFFGRWWKKTPRLRVTGLCEANSLVRGIHQWLVDSPHKGSVTMIMFPFYDVILAWIQMVLFTWECVESCYLCLTLMRFFSLIRFHIIAFSSRLLDSISPCIFHRLCDIWQHAATITVIML